MSVKQWPDSVKRGLRTFFQSFTGIFMATMATSQVVAANGVPHLAVVWAAVMAAAWGGVIAVIAYVQNMLEDKEVIPAVLKEPDS